MKNSILKKTFLSLCVTAISLGVVSCGSSPDDAEIKASVQNIVQENPDFSGVNAEVKDGVVTLTGECKAQGCDSLIASKVKELEGVKEIENSIAMNTGTDLTLRTAVQSIVSKYDGVQADVAAGAVVLRGTIDKNQVEPLMNELKMLNPKKLDNQLALK